MSYGKVEKIAEVMRRTGCTEDQARCELIAEEWSANDAVINLKGMKMTTFAQQDAAGHAWAEAWNKALASGLPVSEADKLAEAAKQAVIEAA